jgi:hypothetical protein
MASNKIYKNDRGKKPYPGGMNSSVEPAVRGKSHGSSAHTVSRPKEDPQKVELFRNRRDRVKATSHGLRNVSPNKKSKSGPRSR